MTAPQLTQYIQGQGVVTADGLNTFMQTTNIVSDLRNFVGTAGITVFTRGLTTVNDGGGGTFYWNSLGSGPDDGVNTIVPFSANTGVWSRVIIPAAAVAQYFTLTSTSVQNFFTPAGARQLRIRMVGGGAGGGGGYGTSAGVAGGGGNSTTFGTLVAFPGSAGGGGAAGGGGVGGVGGNNGTGPYIMLSGGQGGTAGTYNITSGAPGGAGGSSVLGGGARGGVAGENAFGYGGGGGGGQSGPNGYAGGGGGGGAYLEAIINAPVASYSYQCGIGGVGGATGGSYSGGNGMQGVILVEAYF